VHVVADLDRLLEFVDQKIFNLKQRRLRDVECFILDGSWKGQTYGEIADKHNYTYQYLQQDVGPKLWKLLSDIFKEPLSKRNSRTILERYFYQSLLSYEKADGQYSELPSLSSVEILSSVKTVDLSNLSLTVIPDAITSCTDLKILDLSMNQLTSVTEVIAQLVNLKSLSLHNNQLKNFPRVFSCLTNLEELFLCKNQLTGLSDTIAQLTNLKRLDLSNNQLASLPKTMRQLAHLEQLYLHGNDRLGLPPEILGPTSEEVFLRNATPTNPQEILDYYFRTRHGKRYPLNEAKLILVGYGAAGKTSLVNRLVHNTFDKNSLQTEGIQVTQWSLRLNGIENVRLNIWDFGGQEIMHATHQFFLTHRSLYILVLTGRQGHEDADAEYWLNLIESFGDESPVLIVLNKIKSHPFDLNRRALRQKFFNIVDFLETDCETSQGIEILRQTIECETNRLEHLRDAFPASWFGIKDQIATMPENFISFERYRTLCATQGETDPTAQEQLSTYLHNLGIILNYKDDLRLRDTHVLNPQWVTKGIYTILNAKKLAQNKGELNVCDFAAILDSTAYPPERHAYLFELMRKFELCVRFPEDEGRYLIPQLLDKQQPPEADNFDPTECLNFQYHYPTLPEGLLPRFIVRTHTLSKGQPCWRTGVILKFDGDIALVKGDIQDKKVYISVTGASGGRRTLLNIIRSNFEYIHSSFTFQPEEMVPIPKNPDTLIAYKELRIMEKNRIQLFKKVVGEKVLDLSVTNLLNGVDLEGTRKSNPMKDLTQSPLRLFYSYSHKDEEHQADLEIHLTLMKRRGLLETWSDRKITAGQEWEGEIDKELDRANIILLLISPDFIASNYCYDIEMKRAIERHEAKEARVIPIIVRDVDWDIPPLRKLKALPKDAKPVKLWSDKDTAWKSVAIGISTVIQELNDDRHL
jgi:internalin A